MNWQILYKYIEGRCSEKELRQLGQWLSENPANEDFFKTFIEQYRESEHIHFEANARRAWDKFKKNNLTSARLHKVGKHQEPYRSGERYSNSAKKRNTKMYWYYAAAAAVVLTIATLFVIQQHTISDEPDQENEVAYKDINTRKGQRTNLWLSDGTHVTLNADSRLRIPSNYGTASRTIHLEGEAFFDVKHNEERPLVVISGHSYIKDLGTQFNVEAYDSTRIEVAVKEGLVSMGEMRQGKPQEEIAELEPNKLGILDKEGIVVSDISNIDAFTGWTEGKLVFVQTPFAKVVPRLERWFDIEITMEDPELANRTLTATYDKMPLDELLQVLSISLNISYERQKMTVVFRDDKKK